MRDLLAAAMASGTGEVRSRCKDGPDTSGLGYVVRLVWVVAAFAAAVPAAAQTTRAADAVDGKTVLAAIRKHDAAISSVQVSYEVELGVNDKAPQVEKLWGTWAAQGDRELLTDHAGPVTNTSASDGKVVRSLQTAPGVSDGTVMPAGAVPFARESHLPRGLTARCVWEQDFLAALADGRAEVKPAAVTYENARCYEVTGRMMTKARDGHDVAWFKVMLDADRGCMPRYIEEYNVAPDGHAVSRNINDQYVLTEVKPGVWYPTAARQQSLQRDEKGEWKTMTVNRVTLKEIKVNERIPEDWFVVTFPKGARVADFVRGRGPREPLVYVVGESRGPQRAPTTSGAGP